MNTLILITAITLLLLSIYLLRKHEQNTQYKWFSALLFFVSIPFFIMLYGTLAGFFVAIAVTLVSGVFTALCFGKNKFW
jgi:hypothetical protein